MYSSRMPPFSILPHRSSTAITSSLRSRSRWSQCQCQCQCQQLPSALFFSQCLRRTFLLNASPVQQPRPHHPSRLWTRNVTYASKQPQSRFTPPDPPFYKRLWFRYRDNLREASKTRPFFYSLVMASGIFVSLATLVLIYLHVTRSPLLYPPNYPQPVGMPLLRAVYYSAPERLDPALAIRHFREALAAADALHMNPFSREVLGIKIQLVEMFENAGWYDQACGVLESTIRDCEEYVVRERAAAAARRKAATAQAGAYNMVEEKEAMNDHARVLGMVCAMSTKLGNLYSDERMQDDVKAEQWLVHAATIMLSEMRREQRTGELTVHERTGVNIFGRENVAYQLEDMASFFERKDRHHLAAPAYLRALNFIAQEEAKSGKGPSCKQVVLMNNLSISLAQQNPQFLVGFDDDDNKDPLSLPSPPSRAALVQSATRWAEKALDLAATIEPSRRDQDCDVGCAVATHNLGEFAEMQGNVVEAREMYEKAARLARTLNFQEGIQNANEGIKRLRSK